MENKVGDIRIRWYIGWFLCAICSVAVFLPVVSVADLFGISAAENYSLVWYIGQSGFPEIYTVIMVIYYGALAIMGGFGFKRKLQIWPLVVMGVVSVVYTIINLFWIYIILNGTGGYENAVRLSVWSWIYFGVQMVTFINLFSFIPKIKEQ